MEKNIFDKKNIEFEISSSNSLPFKETTDVYSDGFEQTSPQYNNILQRLVENDLYLEQLTLNVKNSRNVPGALVTNSEDVVFGNDEGKKFVLTSNTEPYVRMVHKVMSEIGDSISSVNELSDFYINFVMYDDMQYVVGTNDGLLCSKNPLSGWHYADEDDWMLKSFRGTNCKCCIKNKFQGRFDNNLDRYQYFLGTDSGIFGLNTSGSKSRYWKKIASDSSMAEQEVNKLLIDQNKKLLLIGTTNGLYSTDGTNAKLENNAVGYSVNDIIELEEQSNKAALKDILLATSKGIKQSDAGFYANNPTELTSFTSDIKITSFANVVYNLYIGTTDGTYYFDASKNRLEKKYEDLKSPSSMAYANGKLYSVCNNRLYANNKQIESNVLGVIAADGNIIYWTNDEVCVNLIGKTAFSGGIKQVKSIDGKPYIQIGNAVSASVFNTREEYVDSNVDASNIVDLFPAVKANKNSLFIEHKASDRYQLRHFDTNELTISDKFISSAKPIKVKSNPSFENGSYIACADEKLYKFIYGIGDPTFYELSNYYGTNPQIKDFAYTYFGNKKFLTTIKNDGSIHFLSTDNVVGNPTRIDLKSEVSVDTTKNQIESLGQTIFLLNNNDLSVCNLAETIREDLRFTGERCEKYNGTKIYSNDLSNYNVSEFKTFPNGISTFIIDTTVYAKDSDGNLSSRNLAPYVENKIHSIHVDDGIVYVSIDDKISCATLDTFFDGRTLSAFADISANSFHMVKYEDNNANHGVLFGVNYKNSKTHSFPLSSEFINIKDDPIYGKINSNPLQYNDSKLYVPTDSGLQKVDFSDGISDEISYETTSLFPEYKFKSIKQTIGLNGTTYYCLKEEDGNGKIYEFDPENDSLTEHIVPEECTNIQDFYCNSNTNDMLVLDNGSLKIINENEVLSTVIDDVVEMDAANDVWVVRTKDNLLSVDFTYDDLSNGVYSIGNLNGYSDSIIKTIITNDQTVYCLLSTGAIRIIIDNSPSALWNFNTSISTIDKIENTVYAKTDKDTYKISDARELPSVCRDFIANRFSYGIYNINGNKIVIDKNNNSYSIRKLNKTEFSTKTFHKDADLDTKIIAYDSTEKTGYTYLRDSLGSDISNDDFRYEQYVYGTFKNISKSSSSQILWKNIKDFQCIEDKTGEKIYFILTDNQIIKYSPSTEFTTLHPEEIEKQNKIAYTEKMLNGMKYPFMASQNGIQTTNKGPKIDFSLITSISDENIIAGIKVDDIPSKAIYYTDKNSKEIYEWNPSTYEFDSKSLKYCFDNGNIEIYDDASPSYISKTSKKVWIEDDLSVDIDNPIAFTHINDQKPNHSFYNIAVATNNKLYIYKKITTIDKSAEHLSSFFTSNFDGYSNSAELNDFYKLSDDTPVVAFSISNELFDYNYISSNVDVLSTEIGSKILEINPDYNDNLMFHDINKQYVYVDEMSAYTEISFPTNENNESYSGFDPILNFEGTTYLGSGNILLKYDGYGIDRAFGSPYGKFKILQKKFSDKNVKAIHRISDNDLLVGTSDSAAYVKKMSISLIPTEFTFGETLSGPVNSIIRSDKQLDTGVVTRYMYSSGNKLFSSSDNIELTKEIDNISDRSDFITTMFTQNGKKYFIGTTRGLFLADSGYVLEDDISKYGLLKIKNQQKDLLMPAISEHVTNMHVENKFLDDLSKKAPAKLDKVPPDFTTNNRIGLYNEINVIKNDVVESIEFNDENYYIKASISNWALNNMNGSSVYSEGGFIDRVIDPASGEEIDMSKIPYVFKKWNSGLKEFDIYVPTTMTYYINNPAGFSNSLYSNDSIDRLNIGSNFVDTNVISEKCTTLKLILNNNHFKINNIVQTQIAGTSLPLRIYKDATYCQPGRENLFDTVMQPSVINTIAVMNNSQDVNNTNIIKTANNNIILTFSIYGTDAQSIRILAD